MKTIGIADFEKLVMDRLANSSLFSQNTLILWNDMGETDSLAYTIIEQCCERYNSLNPDNQAWVSYSDLTFATDDYTKINAFCQRRNMFGMKNNGILFNSGAFILSDTLNDWLAFITTHKNTKGSISTNWSLIACANHPELNENCFDANCDVYHLQPSIDEWYVWLKAQYDAAVIDPIVAYIRIKGLTPVSYKWERMFNSLSLLMSNRSVNTLNQLSQHKFELTISGILPSFPVKELWDYINNPD